MIEMNGKNMHEMSNMGRSIQEYKQILLVD